MFLIAVNVNNLLYLFIAVLKLIPDNSQVFLREINLKYFLFYLLFESNIY